jgi:hypothetical protein
MDNERHHIDEYFTEGLENLEITPPEEVWKNIEAHLNKKRAGIIRFWSGMAAGLALLISIGLYYKNVPPTIKNKKVNESREGHQFTLAPAKPHTTIPINRREHINVERNVAGAVIHTEKESSQTQDGMNNVSHKDNVSKKAVIASKATLPSDTIEKKAVASNNPLKEKTIIATKTKKETFFETTRNEALNNKKRTISMLAKDTLSQKQTVALSSINPSEKHPGDTIVHKSVSPAEKTVSAETVVASIVPPQEETLDLSNVPKVKHWSIEGQVAPLFSNRKDNSSQSTVNYNDNEKGYIAYSSGFKVGYKTSRRFSIQVGVYYSVMGQVINNAVAETYSSFAVTSNNTPINSITVSSSNSIGPIANNTRKIITINSSSPASQNAPNVNNYQLSKAYDAAPVEEGKIVREFKFIEVPFLIRYKFIDQKIGCHLVGGVSANFLVNNNAKLVTNSLKQDLGKNEDINVINYSGTIGLGINYKLFKKMNFTVEPTYKYYLNSFSTNKEKDVHPYSFGFFTGITYLF